jgi:hypothetical protein
MASFCAGLISKWNNVFVMTVVVYSKIPWYPKLLFQRESSEGFGNSTKTLPDNDKI